jgi:hypothetical protein
MIATAAMFRTWLAELLEGQAAWRRSKAEEYPEDGRNVRSAIWLEKAAGYVRGLPESHRGLGLFVDLAHELALWVRTERISADPYEIALTGSEVAGRFGFNATKDTPTTSDFEQLIRDVHRETLETWAENIAEGIDQPPRDLVSYFENYGVSIPWQTDNEAPLTAAEERVTNEVMTTLAFGEWARRGFPAQLETERGVLTAAGLLALTPRMLGEEALGERMPDETAEEVRSYLASCGHGSEAERLVQQPTWTTAVETLTPIFEEASA